MQQLLFGMVLFTSTLFLPAGGGEGKTDLELFEGKWAIERLEETGKKASEEFVKTLEAVVKGDQITLRAKDNVVLELRIKIDPTKKPKTIDFTHLAGEDKGKTELGIYNLEGDTLRFCIDESGKNRPTEFKSTPETNLVILKRKSELKK
ncbi:MAG: TIGR03067 domain-containing protein [Planctomycetes bacterium]|nr:TIGR03067 domain-containing protein [Planctomycetota bacterium]